MEPHRFWSSIEVNPDTGCWIWFGVRNKDGYGVANAKELAHQWSYRTFIGPIPRGGVVMHSCDTPACVCPEHLSVGTQGENNKDAGRKGRSRNQWSSRKESP